MAITKVSRNLLNTGVSDSSDSTAITINSSEQVGIGETSPLGKLHVKTADSGGSADSGADELVLENSGAAGITILSGTANSGSVRFGDSDDNDNGMLVYNHGSSPYMRLFTGGSVRVRLDADGLKFGSDTAATNALDDYEEGIHVATVTCGTSGTVTLNGAYSDLSYTKIGRIVTVTGLIIVSSVSSPVGHYLISLPFTCGNLTDRAADSAVTIQHHYGYNAGAGSYTAFLPEGYSQIHVYRGDVGTTRSSTSAEEIRPGTQIVVSVTYVVA